MEANLDNETSLDRASTDFVTATEAEIAYAEELRRQYSIGYYPEMTGEPGERRSIKIQILAHPNVVVRAKRNYVVKRERPSEPSVN